MVPPSDFNQRQTDTKLADIEKMITEENDTDKRNYLQILQFLTNQSVGIVKGISMLESSVQKDLEAHRNRVDVLQRQLDKQQDELSRHHDLVTSSKGSWKTFMWVVGGVTVLATGIGAYGYQVIDDLRVTVIEMKSAAQSQSALYPELIKQFNSSNKSESAITDMQINVKELQHTLTDLQYRQQDLDTRITEVETFKENTVHKKVWRAMK